LSTKTFEAGAEAQIDLILQLKDNQPTLHQQGNRVKELRDKPIKC
jgi:hypothetical protein